MANNVKDEAGDLTPFLPHSDFTKEKDSVLWLPNLGFVSFQSNPITAAKKQNQGTGSKCGPAAPRCGKAGASVL